MDGGWRGPSGSRIIGGRAIGIGVARLGCGVDMVVAPDSVCPKCITGALKLKFGGIKGVALYPVGAERPGARPGAPKQNSQHHRGRPWHRTRGAVPCPYPYGC